MSILSGQVDLTAEESSEVDNAKGGRAGAGYAQRAINEFLSLPKVKQRQGIKVPVSNFSTPDKHRDVAAVIQGINGAALRADAPVVAKRSTKNPETHVVLKYGAHSRTGPRKSKNDGDAPAS